MKHFAGLDVSLQETAICVVDEDGIIVIEGKAASEPADLIRWWRLSSAGSRCRSPAALQHAVAAMAVKTDRNDARAIAHAMRIGWFTSVHVKTAESQELRLLLNNRRTLIESKR